MIKYSFIISLFLLLGHSQVYAQLGYDTGLTKRNIRNIEFVMYSNGIDPVGNASLKDYYNQEWETVSVISNANVIQKYNKARYNLDTKNLEFQVDKKVYFLATKEIKKLVFTESNKTFIAKKEEPKLGLLEVVAEYKDILLVTAYEITKLSENQTTSSFYGGTFESEKIEKYYLLKPNESLFKLSKNKKKNAKFFAEYWSEIAKFIKKEKPSFKKKNDIMKIMDVYTGLKG